MGSQSPNEKRHFWGKGSFIVKYRDFLPWAVQKRLNRSICHLGCGLGCAEGSISPIVFARWRQCALPCGHIGATWQIRLNRPSAVAMRSYVKLLWPLVWHCDQFILDFHFSRHNQFETLTSVAAMCSTRDNVSEMLQDWEMIAADYQ